MPGNWILRRSKWKTSDITFEMEGSFQNRAHMRRKSKWQENEENEIKESDTARKKMQKIFIEMANTINERKDKL